ncbi:MAG TPA: efflux RND transporter periplasmic adaptor subunit [Phycisphaerales bacterium]|nr:efflux RND transporter periplasmic adaptor subunit [Phycisphaerales bacterium]
MGVLILVAALALFRHLVSTRHAPTQRDISRALPVVRAVECVSRPVPRRWMGYGTARAMNASDVAAEVAGRVVSRPGTIEEGAAVGEGEVLIVIDPADYEQRVRSARQRVAGFEADLSRLEVQEARLREQAALLDDELAIAQRDLDRARDALKQGAGNASQIDARLQALKAVDRNRAAVLSQLEAIGPQRAATTASLESARADLRLAEQNLERTTVRSPFAGFLQRVDLDVGEWARAGVVVARVVDLSRIEVPVRLPESAVYTLAPGDPVTLRTGGGVPREWVGEVVRIAPEADATTRSATVFVEIHQRPDADAASLLRPGQFVAASVDSGKREPMLIVPRPSVDVDRVLVAAPLGPGDPDPPAGAERPMVVREARVHVTRHIEAEFGDISPEETQWSVLSEDGISPGRALREGDLVIVSNLESLKPGDLIDVRVGSDRPREPGEPGLVRRPGDGAAEGDKP